MGRNLKWPAVIELIADLGGGKTTFVRGLLQGLGSADKVSSPTFTLKNIYKFRLGEVHHFDFYRLKEAGVVRDQLAESLKDPKVISIIEWADIVEDVLPPTRLSINFKSMPNDADERLITISYPQSLGGLIKALETAWAEVEP